MNPAHGHTGIYIFMFSIYQHFNSPLREEREGEERRAGEEVNPNKNHVHLHDCSDSYVICGV